MTKFCTGCKENKWHTEFRPRSDNPNKLRSRCKSCLSKAGVSYNQAHKIQVYKNNKNTRERSKTIAQLRYASFKQRLKDRVKLSEFEYCKIFENDPPCIYCGLLIRATGSGLDRIDNSKDYTIDNVNPCCGTCNDIRGDNLTVEEMKVAMNAVLQHRKSLL
jgi:hypothetical protein